MSSIDQVAAESPKSPITSTEITSTSTISRLFATADAASTPKPRSVESKSAQTPANPVVSVAVQMSPKQQPATNASPAFDQTSPPNDADDADGDVASNASSFKFVRGSPSDEPHRRTAVENEENIAATANVPDDSRVDTKSISAKPSDRSKSRSTRADTSAAASSQYDSHTDEIIRTILCSTTSDQSSVEPSVLVADSVSASAGQNSSSSRNSTMMQDLQRGIELLDQLVESERLNKATKKRLVKKIVNGLLRAKYNISSTSLGDDDTTITSTTNVSASSKRSKKTSSKVTENPRPTSAANSHGISAIAHSSPAPRSVDAVVVATATVPPIARSASSSASMQWLKPLTRSELDYEKHRQRQQPKATAESVKLQWIQKEIQQLVNLQDFLVHKQQQQQQQSERDRRLYQNTGLDRNASTSTDNYYCQVTTGGGVGSTAKYNSSTTTYASTKNSIAQRNDRKMEAPLSTGVATKHKPQHGAPLDDSSDSPLIVQKFVRNRTKLRTPCTAPHDTDVHVDDDDDAHNALSAYARSKQREFLKQYTQTGRPTSSQDERTVARDLIYAHPYGEPPLAAFHRKPASPTNVAGHHRHHMHPGRHRANSRSNSSGNTFLSSNSVSIPDMQSSSYPEVVQLLREPRSRSRRRSESVAIQTSDSLLKPILKQQRQPQDAASECRVLSTEQPPPPPVFYTITFDNWAAPPAAAQGDVDADAPTAFTVQQCLRDARPRFLIAANRRRDCVRQLNALRQQRNAERQRVFQELHDADDDVDELCRRLRGMEAPKPLAQRRCFTTRELLAATRQRCRQLPEVRARSAEERQRRERRAQRLLRDVYGRELQRRALLGRVNLSNSVMVAN